MQLKNIKNKTNYYAYKVENIFSIFVNILFLELNFKGNCMKEGLVWSAFIEELLTI